MTNQKNDPFKVVNEQLPFFPDKTKEKNVPQILIGLYISSLILGDSEKIEERIPVYIFADVETGEKLFVIQSYAVRKAVEAALREYPNGISEIVFRLEYLGKTEVDGKPFNKFNTGYCTLDNFNSSKELPPIEDKPKKK